MVERVTIMSPCTGVCRLDVATGFCLGCARTGDEIARWSAAPDAWRARVWAALPARCDALGIALRRLAFTSEDTRDFLAASLAAGKGTWVMGLAGALGAFAVPPGASVEVAVDGDQVTATTPGARLRARIDDDVRALGFRPTGTAPETMPVVLAVARARKRLPLADNLTDLGPDTGAIDPAERTGRLFDLGVGRKEARYLVRVAPGPACEALLRHVGTPFRDSLPLVGPALMAGSPVRVIETALGRLEVTSPAPPPGDRSPEGPNIHLLPARLASGAALPAGMELPRAYLPGAIFYPPGTERPDDG